MAIDGISKELVEKSDCGIYVEPDDAKDLAGKVRMYLKNKDQARKQGENGYNYARKHFDRETMAIEYLRELEKLVN